MLFWSDVSSVRRVCLFAAIAVPLIALAVFKYLTWFSDILPILAPLQRKIAFAFGDNGKIVLPPGISFYVFEALSFSIDVYRRKIVSKASAVDYLTFIAMFPRFIAGPIVRFRDMEDQFRTWTPEFDTKTGKTGFSVVSPQ